MQCKNLSIPSQRNTNCHVKVPVAMAQLVNSLILNFSSLFYLLLNAHNPGIHSCPAPPPGFVFSCEPTFCAFLAISLLILDSTMKFFEVEKERSAHSEVLKTVVSRICLSRMNLKFVSILPQSLFKNRFKVLKCQGDEKTFVQLNTMLYQLL